MHASSLRTQHIDPGVAATRAVAALFVGECLAEAPGVAMPHAEPHIVVRFGPAVRGGLDVHAMGARRRAHRKMLPGGQRTVIARLRLGTYGAILGVQPPALADRIVPLEELWGAATVGRLIDRLSAARDLREAATIVADAIAARLVDGVPIDAHARLVLAAAEPLQHESVAGVADRLGVSERSLRRAFHEVVGMGPKSFAKLARFGRALQAARTTARTDWARIAADAGYYDQAHLIGEFRNVAGVTPRALLGELAAAMS